MPAIFVLFLPSQGLNTLAKTALALISKAVKLPNLGPDHLSILISPTRLYWQLTILKSHLHRKRQFFR